MTRRVITGVALAAVAAAGCLGRSQDIRVLAESRERAVAGAALARAAVSFHGEAGPGFERDVARELEARVAAACPGVPPAPSVAHGVDVDRLVEVVDALGREGGRAPETPVAAPGGADRVVAVLLVWVQRFGDGRAPGEHPVPALVTRTGMFVPPQRPDAPAARAALAMLARIDGASGRVVWARAVLTQRAPEEAGALEALAAAVCP